MRIAIISYHTCPLASLEGKETGGMNVYVLELSRALARKGHRVDVFTRSHEKNDVLITSPGPNLRVMHVPAGPQAQLSKKKLVRFIPEFVRAYQSFVKKQHVSYDVVHAHYYQSGLAAQSLGQPFIMSFHTLNLRSEQKRVVYTRNERIIFIAYETRNTCHIRCNDRCATADSLKRHHAERFIVRGYNDHVRGIVVVRKVCLLLSADKPYAVS